MSASAWVLTLALIAALLAVDWLWLGRRARHVGLSVAIGWSAAYVAVALLFGVGLGLLEGWDLATQYLAGYAVEKSLSVDNLFVFVIIMGAFAVPEEAQPRALTLGIVLALVIRTGLIALGATLLAAFSAMFLVFGLVLIATAVGLMRHRNDDPSIHDNVLVAVARRTLPVSPDYAGQRILTRVDGQRKFTPLLLALIAIGTTDVLFAFDSIPAVFGVTHHAFIVFAANAFALLGLRALYFLVSGLLERLVYLSSGLAFILAFVGVKLVLEFAHGLDARIPEISTGLSLAVVAVAIVVTALASRARAARDRSARAHAGSVYGRRRAVADGVVDPGAPPNPPGGAGPGP